MLFSYLGPSASSPAAKQTYSGKSGKDDSFREFRRLCAEIAEENSYTGKTAIVSKFITKGSSGGCYDVFFSNFVWFCLLSAFV